MRHQHLAPFRSALACACLCGSLIAGCSAPEHPAGDPSSGREGLSSGAAEDSFPARDAEAEWPRRFPESVAPFVTTPHEVVRKMLELAGVGPADTVYDLGCGDGRILILAAASFGADAVGVELDPEYFRLARANVESASLEGKVQVLFEDLMQADISGATVVTIFLSPQSNRRLKPRFESMLAPGVRIVSHNFEIPGWEPAELKRIKDDDGWSHWIYLYRR